MREKIFENANIDEFTYNYIIELSKDYNKYNIVIMALKYKFNEHVEKRNITINYDEYINEWSLIK